MLTSYLVKLFHTLSNTERLNAGPPNAADQVGCKCSG